MNKPEQTERLKATEKVYQLKESMSDLKLANKIGITKKTLYTRLIKSNWTKGEVCLINSFDI